MSERVAFIGVGIMGRGIVQNLQKQNIHLSLYARNKEKILDLKNSSTMVFQTPEECVENSSHTIFCLTDDSIVENTYERVKRNLKGTLLDFGTTSPSLTRRIFDEQTAMSNTFISSPMTGSKLASEQGQIVYMVGARSEDAILDSIFLWKITGKKYIYCGSPEDAQKVKISLNLTQALILQAYMEGSILSESIGISANLYKEIITHSAARSGISDFKLDAMEGKNFSPNFSLKNMNKDIEHAMRLAGEKHLSLPLSYAIQPLYNEGMKKNLGDEDFVSLYKINLNRNDMSG